MGQTREQIYTQQLKDLGIWEDAFAPMVKELAQLDRRRTRLQKAWAASAPPGGKPSFLDPHYALIVQAERDALAYREAMGLTPKSLRRLRGQPVAVVGGEAPESLSAKLDRMLEREDPDTAWSFEEMAQAVPTVGTGIETPSTAEAVSKAGNVAPRVSILPETPQAAGGGKLNE